MNMEKDNLMKTSEPISLILEIKKNTDSSFGFPGGSAGKENACNEGDLGLIPGLGRSIFF